MVKRKTCRGGEGERRRHGVATVGPRPENQWYSTDSSVKQKGQCKVAVFKNSLAFERDCKRNRQQNRRQRFKQKHEKKMTPVLEIPFDALRCGKSRMI